LYDFGHGRDPITIQDEQHVVPWRSQICAGSAITLRPPAACEKLNRLIRWSMPTEWVTEGILIQVTCVMLAASGVCTKNACPWPHSQERK